MLENKHILLFGGSGSLGNQFIETYINMKILTNFYKNIHTLLDISNSDLYMIILLKSQLLVTK